MKERIKRALKKTIPSEMISQIRLGIEVGYYKKLMLEIEHMNGKSDFIIGTPLHTNLGDHLITLAERYYLNKIDYKRNIIEIPTEMYQIYKNRLQKAISRDSVIFINGGGWMGNLWPNEELLIQDIVSTFKNNKILIFPQTIYYDTMKSPCEELLFSGTYVFKQCSDLTLCVRERQSYMFACAHFKHIKIILLPDIALAYNPELPETAKLSVRKTVKFCLRSDREENRVPEHENALRQLLLDHEFLLKNINTLSMFRVPYFAREKCVLKRIREFSECGLVVTDRLHGMIFAYLAGTPCIVFDNKTGKVSGVYDEWLKESTHILPLFEGYNEHLVRNFIEYIDVKLQPDKINIEPHFTILQKEILNGKN